MIPSFTSEKANTALSPAVAKTVGAATALGGDVHILVAGAGARPVAEAAARLEGVAKVLLADAPHLAHQLAEEVATSRAVTIFIFAPMDFNLPPTSLIF